MYKKLIILVASVMGNRGAGGQKVERARDFSLSTLLHLLNSVPVE